MGFRCNDRRDMVRMPAMDGALCVTVMTMRRGVVGKLGKASNKVFDAKRKHT